MSEQIEKLHAADVLARDFYRYTAGQPGTEHFKVFTILNKVHELGLKKEFSNTVTDVFIQKGKQPKQVEEVLQNELTGSLEKRGLALYKDGSDEKVKTTFGDKIKGGLEKALEFPLNHPVGFLAGILGLAATTRIKSKNALKVGGGFLGSAFAAMGISGYDDFKYVKKVDTLG